MKNFIILFRFENSQAREQFKQSIEAEFDRLRKQTTEEFTYYLVGEYNLPALEDTLNNFINGLGINDLIRTGDYVAVYFDDDFEPEFIKRQMVFGKDEYIDNHIKKKYEAQHVAILEDLLDYDFLKHQSR